MKGIIYLGVAVALLRSAAAFLPSNNDQYDAHDQLNFQPAKGANKAVNAPAVSTEYVEERIPAQRFSTDAPQVHDVVPPGSEPTQELDDVNVTPDLPPRRPNFTIGSSTSQWAITYTPYTSTLSCLPPSTIRSDVATIARKGFTSIRLYSIDCSALRHIGPLALTHGLKLIIGIPLDDGPADAATQLSDIVTWATSPTGAGNWALVELVVVGNEAIFNAHTTAPTLASLIASSRARLRAAGYPGPLTTTEPLSVLHRHRRTLCPVLDLPAANIQPFFHPAVSAHAAGSHVRQQLDALAEVCPGFGKAEAVNLETGWPRRGRPNGVAVPGFLEQWIAVAGIMEGAGGRSVVLGFEDEGWKDEGAFGVERSWGCGHVFGEGGRE